MKNNYLGFALVAVAGLFVGWLIGSQGGSPASESHMHDTMGAMTAGLMDKSGADFDRAFLDEMIVHHEGAVEMGRMVLEMSTRPELTAFAEQIISVQTAEIEKMKEWRANWFK